MLVGGADNDLLKGGDGFDIDISNIGDGQDTIDDSDGVGVLIYDNGALTGGVRQTGDPAGTFVSTSGRFQYVKTGADLAITDLANTGNVLTVQNFHNPDFGIRLVDASEFSTATRPAGFYANALATETADGTGGSDGIGPIGGSGARSVNIISSLLGGNDWIFANDLSQGNHQFVGGLGNDQLEGSLGRDQRRARERTTRRSRDLQSRRQCRDQDRHAAPHRVLPQPPSQRPARVRPRALTRRADESLDRSSAAPPPQGRDD